MRLTVDIKAFCLRAMIGCLVVLSTNAAASSVEILVDAALDQKSLQTASELALQVVRAAGDENSVGMVVYDEVFQRSTENTVADEAHVDRISRLFESIVPTEFSNVAVGIEKGISELNAEGGVLLVFGNSDILLTDNEAAAKYSDWLKLVLLPDAASKSIATILVVAQNTQPSALESMIQAYPNNRVISYSDNSDAIEQLSAVLPFRLSKIAPSDVLANQSLAEEPILSSELMQGGAVGEIVSPTIKQSIPQDADQTVATSQVSNVVAVQSDRMGPGLSILLAVIALLLLVVVVIILCLLKRKRDEKHELSGNSPAAAAIATPCRYLAPKRGVATVATPRAAETDEKPAIVEPQTRASQRFADSDQFDKYVITESEPANDDMGFELDDVTAPRKPVKSDATTKIVRPDATVPRVAVSRNDSKEALAAGAIDELEELRNVTQLKHEILN